MARKKGVNQSQRVRDYMGEHPEAKAGEIAEALGVPASLVYNVRSNASKGGGKAKVKKRGRPRKSSVASSSKAVSNGTQLDAIRQAAELVKSCGSIEKAREVLDTVEAVTRAVR